MSYDNIWQYSTLPNGVTARDITVKAKKDGAPLKIVHITDMHLNLCNEKDFEENDPVIMSTYEHRIWLRNGEALENALRCLDSAKDADATVITGDILDYLSYGCIELAQKHIFNHHQGIIASLGNHETARNVQGKRPDAMPIEEKKLRLQAIWPNDISYSSRVIDERVMIIQMDDCSNERHSFKCDPELLKKDIEISRANGYIALLFFHVNIATKNDADKQSKALTVGDKNYSIIDLDSYGVSEDSKDASRAVCEIIKNSADVIKGCFCGHMHSDFYCEIEARNADGSKARIPQYLLIGAPYGKGHILNINIE